MVTCTLQNEVEQQTKLNGLHSKSIFDKVCVEIKRPEFDGSGINGHLDSVGESDKGTLNTPILSELPNLYKQYGSFVENLGYFIIPRSVTEDPRYKGARLKYQKVLHVLFENVAFAPTTHAIGVEVIPIAIGQFCVSERQLVDLCNEGVGFKEDQVDKNIVRRAVHFWTRCQIVNRQVNHDKTLITITVPDFYNREKKRSEPSSEPEVNQKRTTKEEDKELKDNISSPKTSKKKAPFVASPFATSLLTEFYSSLLLAIPDFPEAAIKKTKTEYQAAEAIGKQCNHDMDLIRKVIAWAHTGFWLDHVHTVTYLRNKFTKLVQQLRTQGSKPMSGKKPQPKYNHDTSASLPSKNLSFAEPS